MCLIEEMSKTAGASSTVSCCPQDGDIQLHLIECFWDSSSMKRREEPPCMRSGMRRGEKLGD